MRPTIVHLWFTFDAIRFTALQVIADKPRVNHLPEIFRVPCRENYALDRKMFDTFLMISACSITMQSLGEIAQRAPAVGAKMCRFFFTLRVRNAVRSRGA